MHLCKFSLLLLLLPCHCLPTFPQNNASASSALNGNWHLTGTGDKSMDFSLGKDGNEVYGEGDLSISCIDGANRVELRGGVFVEGPIAPDGSFVLGNPHAFTVGNGNANPDIVKADVLTIRGKLPTPGSDQWSGSFALSAFTATNSPTSADCEADSGDFTAQRLADIRGAYKGSYGLKKTGYEQFIHEGGTEGYVSLEITQGEMTATRAPGEFGHVIAANGRVTLTGSTKFPSGTFSAETKFDANTRILDGKAFMLQLPRQNDGAVFIFYGRVDDQDKNRLQIEIRYMSKDGHGKYQTVLGFGWLTRQ
jgi:hypothetical protein